MTALVLAKSPVTGRVKTRLGRDVGPVVAADLAAAALLDTLSACRAAFGAENCHLALDGDLSEAARGQEIRSALAGWSVRAQHGGELGERIARAHLELCDTVSGSVVQIGMDTPQVTPSALQAMADLTLTYDAVLGPAEDGGWWVLAQRDPAGAAALVGVPMSTERTHEYTREALERSGCSVGTGPELRDVDNVADAEAVAALVPDSEFGRAWRLRAGVHR